jgi:hypothetical protein
MAQVEKARPHSWYWCRIVAVYPLITPRNGKPFTPELCHTCHQNGGSTGSGGDSSLSADDIAEMQKDPALADINFDLLVVKEDTSKKKSKPKGKGKPAGDEEGEDIKGKNGKPLTRKKREILEGDGD